MSAKEILKNIFGYSEFRPGQEEIINSILNGNNVLTIFPTGGGKSLCYQIPALAGDSFSLVISPLIALMKDQVDGLNEQKQIAAYINSSLDYLAAEKVLNNIKNGEIKLLYVSPEKLDNISFAERIKNLAPKYVFVDEAHCISEWGHNFRPSYRRIKEFCEFIKNDSISAFTATAIPEVRRDIIEHLNFKNPRIFIKGFERENLFLNVIKTHQKKEATLELIRKYNSPAVIYTATRKGAEEISEFLNMNGFVSSYYHAGLPPEQRRIIQDDFMQDRVKIISATNAFGMGVDKPDIRLLIHYNMPGTIENYYQEIGRAGRDDIDSKIFLLYEEKDLSIQEFFINNNYPSRNEIELVYNKICDSVQLAVGSMFEKDIPLNNVLIKSLSQQRINKQKVLSVVKLLEEHGYLKFKNDAHSNHYAKILFSKNDLRTYVDKFARKSLKD
ncbi:MAG: ATP-dependent DNA helicase RecQ, partial [Melioribacteraceae bacterium]|nr:ATP-dependent DNA helicase RecQ [Melioribacteraceae bacterium]